jgi:hypothetical protein
VPGRPRPDGASPLGDRAPSSEGGRSQALAEDLGVEVARVRILPAKDRRERCRSHEGDRTSRGRNGAGVRRAADTDADPLEVGGQRRGGLALGVENEPARVHVAVECERRRHGDVQQRDPAPPGSPSHPPERRRVADHRARDPADPGSLDPLGEPFEGRVVESRVSVPDDPHVAGNHPVSGGGAGLGRRRDPPAGAEPIEQGHGRQELLVRGGRPGDVAEMREAKSAGDRDGHGRRAVADQGLQRRPPWRRAQLERPWGVTRVIWRRDRGHRPSDLGARPGRGGPTVRGRRDARGDGNGGGRRGHGSTRRALHAGATGRPVERFRSGVTADRAASQSTTEHR